MHLSASALPIDLKPALPDANLSGGGSSVGDASPTSRAFSALLNDRTEAAPSHDHANHPTRFTLGGNHSAASARSKSKSSDTVATDDPQESDATKPEGPAGSTGDESANQDALAGWLAANGFLQPPPTVPAPPTAELKLLPAQNAPGEDNALSESSGPVGGAAIAAGVALGEDSPGLSGTTRTIAQQSGSRESIVRAAYAGAGDFRAVKSIPAAAATPRNLENVQGAIESSPVPPAQSPPFIQGPANAASLPAVAPGAAQPSEISASALPATSTIAVTAAGVLSLTSNPQEKIAAAPQGLVPSLRGSKISDQKKSLVMTDEQVADGTTNLGINAAKSGDVMPVAAPFPVHPSIGAEPQSYSAPSLDFAALVKTPPPAPASELAGDARRTVESVLAVADHFTTGGQHGVTLKFSVSGVDLSVRVEVRGGNIQTTFRTDSSELRAALANEWRAVTAEQSGTRPQRLNDPVFTASARDSFQADSGSADQRGSGTRQGQPWSEEFSAPRSAQRPASTVPATTVSVPLVALTTSGRLHTFA